MMEELWTYILASRMWYSTLEHSTMTVQEAEAFPSRTWKGDEREKVVRTNTKGKQ